MIRLASAPPALPPRVSLDRERALVECLLALHEHRAIRSAHDLANGGLAVALAGLSLRKRVVLGVRQDFPAYVRHRTGGRRLHALAADGPLNLLQAVRLAVSPHARGRGVLVVNNDTVFAGRHVAKATTFRAIAFTGADMGPVGHVEADGSVDLRMRHHSNGTPLFDVTDVGRMPRVDVRIISGPGHSGKPNARLRS